MVGVKPVSVCLSKNKDLDIEQPRQRSRYFTTADLGPAVVYLSKVLILVTAVLFVSWMIYSHALEFYSKALMERMTSFGKSLIDYIGVRNYTVNGINITITISSNKPIK